MKKTIQLLACAAILCSAILNGCQKTGISGSNDGTIRFSASAKSATTKTAYSGTVTNKVERIDWLETDQIRIWSDQAKHRYLDQNYADYQVKAGSISTVEPKSTAEIIPITEYNGMLNGLVWGEDAASKAYSFYSIYPSTLKNSQITIGAGGTVTAKLPDNTTLTAASATKYVDASGNVVATADQAAYTYSVFAPDMNYAYMTAAAQGQDPGDNQTKTVELSFVPAFTAFEINLTSAEDATDGFTLSGLSLTAAGANDYLAGTYTMTAGDLTTVQDKKNEDNTSAGLKTVGVTFPDNTTISQTAGVTTTLFALPMTNAGLITLTVATTTGTATLPLTAQGSEDPYIFAAGTKYRINLLKVGNQWKYKITLAPEAMTWDLTLGTTTYADQIQAGTTEISGMTETANNYLSNDTSLDAAYEAAEDKEQFKRDNPGYNPQYYQVRTLKTDVTDPYFEMVIYPKAPQGGYWMLQPQMENGGFRIVVWDEDAYADDPDYTGSTDLWGQIMNKPVTLHIYPEKPLSQMDRTKAYTLYFNAIFATDRDFENYYNADTEVQDAHGDGTFSYWYFVIPVL